MICVAIRGPTFKDAEKQIAEAIPHADLVELRLDCFHELDLSALQSLLANYQIPFLFTLRDQSQGGNYARSEEERLKDILLLAQLNPDYLDIESHVPTAFIEGLLERHPKVKLILSYHDFVETPKELDAIFYAMQSKPAYFYKIATMAHSTLDMLRMLICVQASDKRLIGISMGEFGVPSRIIGSVVGSPITYACLDIAQKTAPGQISAQLLNECYHYRHLNPSTILYCLIGDPIKQSISEITHNALFHALGKNAVYIKMLVHTEEMDEFFRLIKQLPFRGLSVTMPHKEQVMEYVDETDEMARSIGAVNTLLIEDGRIKAINTDGIGALNAVEKHRMVAGKKVILLGAGGAAKAIAYEASKRGAELVILNRKADRAEDLAEHFSGIGGALDLMKQYREQGYDVLVNSTPIAMPIDAKDLLDKALVMDIKIKPMDNQFLKSAQEMGCQVIYGYEMFVEQALGQFSFWFPEEFDISHARVILEQESLRALN